MEPTPGTGQSTVSGAAAETARPQNGIRLRPTLRTLERSGSPWVRRTLRALRRTRDVLVGAVAYVRDPAFRWAYDRLRAGDPRMHQPTVVSWPDRYPRIFEACRVLVPDHPGLRILSFGCASGEEVVTLRRYFPTAQIIGCELNPVALSRCRKLVLDDGVRFVASEFRDLAALGPFDLVFCMAVLQRLPDVVDAYDVQDISTIYPFEQFDQQIAELDAVVRTGGMIVVHHAQYFFRDTSVAWKYDVIPVVTPALVGRIRFTRDGRRADDPVPSGWIRRKVRTDPREPPTTALLTPAPAPASPGSRSTPPLPAGTHHR